MTCLVRLALSARRIARQSSRSVGAVRPASARAVSTTSAELPVDERGHLKFSTLHEMITNTTARNGDRDLFGTYHSSQDGDGTFEWTTYGDFGRRVALCRTALKDVGVSQYSKVGVISNNREEWAVTAAAIYSLNATMVPLYESQLPKDWAHILNDAGCCSLLVSTEEIYLKAKQETLPNTPLVRAVLCFDSPDDEPHSFRGALARAERMTATAAIEPSPEDLANLIYTSGTTGKPKGVELVHSNQVSNIKACRDMGSSREDFVLPEDRSLTFLPWAHSYGQTCELWCLLSQGASMGICRGVPYILDDLQMVKPSLLFAVPTLYKRVYGGVANTLQSASPLQQQLMRSAFRLGKAHAEHRNGDAPPLALIDRLKHKVLDEIVLSKIRANFGGNLRAAFSAGAKTPKEIVQFMDSVGITLCEGYGLTETSPVIALSVLSKRRPGCVGLPVPGVDVYILDPEGNPLPQEVEGEVCCSGPNVMRGYHNNREATDEVISFLPDGKTRVFHTGDLGVVDKDGFVSITGRLKELYKLENGKYCVPTLIEEAIGMSRFISQTVVSGADRPYNIALVVPDWAAIRNEFGVLSDDVSEEELVNDPRVKGLLSAEIKLHCYDVKKYETPVAFLVVAPFTAANGQLTPKMSIRRHVVICDYAGLIDKLYGGKVENGGYLREENKLKAA